MTWELAGPRATPVCLVISLRAVDGPYLALFNISLCIRRQESLVRVKKQDWLKAPDQFGNVVDRHRNSSSCSGLCGRLAESLGDQVQQGRVFRIAVEFADLA